MLTRDEHLEPYFFPKGTMFIVNAWTIHRNEDEYDRPHDFIPERFLNNPFGLRPSLVAAAENLENSGRRALYAFGSGRLHVGVAGRLQGGLGLRHPPAPGR